MPELLLQTKLYIPPLRSNLVPRPRLIERLNEGLHRKLTLISAPAGFGKTTLVSEWVAGGERPAAWLSLDERDNDPTRFLAYLVASLQTIEANIGEGVLAVLQSPQPPPTESILTALLNEITTIPDNFVLVLDDYHVIDAKPVDNALSFLLEHLPHQMHLALASRADPSLLLARLRGRGELTELRAADLRFTPDEAATFLNQVMGLGLSAEEVTALETRTEGWIVGLQMAALSMQGRADTVSFIQAFTGSHHFIIDYLVEEVLQRQPERVRGFLLQTAILDRLSGPLCDAVTGQEDGKGMLQALKRDNLFVVPLDDKRQWYRYHHLFADVLHTHLMGEQPDRAPTLHRRASDWYERNGLSSDAVRHALAAEDFERSAGLIELAWPAMDRSFQSVTWLGWARLLPDELVRARPVLSFDYAWMILNRGELEAGEARLRDAERWLDTMADMSERSEAVAAEMVVIDEEQFVTLPGTIATARAYHAQAIGDVPSTEKYARRALDLLPEEDYLWRGIAAGMLGLAHWASGDLETAYRSLADGMASFQMAGNFFAISGTFILADIRIAQGRLHDAVRTYEQSLQLATEQGEPVLRGMANLHAGLSELHLEQGDLEAARKHLLKSEELGEQALMAGGEYRLRIAMARAKGAQGDLSGALDLLDEAERLYSRNPLPDVRPIAALKARVWVTQGRLTEALGWAREQGPSVDDELSYLREFERITMARVLLAQYKSNPVDGSIHEALGLLERLLKAAEEGERTGSVIEILVLQALARESEGDLALALVPLERALTLAEPEGYVRLFVDESNPMAQLLSEATVHGIEPDYIAKLLAVFEAEGQKRVDKSYPPPAQPLIEPLSKRELEILALITAGLKNKEIAEQLVISLNTVLYHIKNIYRKLGVNKRTLAVAKARELNLLRD